MKFESRFDAMPSLEEEEVFAPEISGDWAEAYAELMGSEDEVDVYFILPSEEDHPDLENEDDLFVLRVMGLPEEDLTWVH